MSACLLGSYASQNDLFAVSTTAFFGIAGYGLKKIDVHPAPIVLALVLGYLTESNLRRALLASSGDPAVFFTHPIAVICLLAAVATLLLPFLRKPAHAAPAADHP